MLLLDPCRVGQNFIFLNHNAWKCRSGNEPQFSLDLAGSSTSVGDKGYEKTQVQKF